MAISLGNVANLAGNLLSYFNSMKFQTQKNLLEFPCVIAEISESQEYAVPTYPVESLNYKGDTIYKMPQKVQVRAFVEASDFVSFEFLLNYYQYESDDFIRIEGLGNKVYKNLKITAWSRETTSQMVGAAYYNISLQEMILVNSYSAENVSNASYSKSKNTGNKAAAEQDRKSSALFKLFN